MNSQLTSSGSGLAHHVAQSGAELQQILSSIASTANSVKDASEPLAETSRQIASASDRLSIAAKAMDESAARTHGEMRQVADMLQSSLAATAKQWEDYESRFANVDESLSSVIEQIVKSVQDAIDLLNTFVERIDEKLSGSVDRLGGGIDELLEFAQTIEHATARFRVNAAAESITG
ncbi:methyl-accepting chemotaxis protein [Bradyrhizobium sp. S3.3.6]|uniref:hypothetical protein n=1 Tax=Bradyrhizobium sp. S3.3.6 TaxID=3156429 RepID=UPI00339AAE25